nr:flavodoxin family protein [uncultured Bacteroides sp.]
MKKIMIIDGGPRKTFNTAKMIEAFTAGAKEADETIEVKHVRLYDINYYGCVACMACKVKNSKFTEYCAYKDGITEVLKETAFADGIVFASPIFYSDITAQLRAFIERLTFPWLSYNNYTTHAPKRVPTAIIYTMNATEEYQPQMEAMYDRNESLVARFLTQPERIIAMNTLQVKNYDLYEMAGFSKEKKGDWHKSHWELELQNAHQAGIRMVKQLQ